MNLVIVVLVERECVVTKLISWYFLVNYFGCKIFFLWFTCGLLIDLEVINLTPSGSRFRYKDSLLESIWFQIGDYGLYFLCVWERERFCVYIYRSILTEKTQMYCMWLCLFHSDTERPVCLTGSAWKPHWHGLY